MTHFTPTTRHRSVNSCAEIAVTFVIPCYNLAHLLPDCIESILSQDFEDFEILIMDDCSPDNTPEVAASFNDARVFHVRNERNLRHLANYNRGIKRARGRYVWLISADDYLRRPDVVRKYVELMDRNPQVGYACCSGVGVRDGIETGILDYSVAGTRDFIVPGHTWLRQLLKRNIVLAASGCVRRECYLEFGAFPLDMPWAGDWYLWLLFSLYRDVAYFHEPMVCYREHSLSMTTQLTATKAAACCAEEIEILWQIKRRADAAGWAKISRECLEALSAHYAKSTVAGKFGLAEPVNTLEQFEESLCASSQDEAERKFVRARVWVNMGSACYWRGDIVAANRWYRDALKLNPIMPAVVAKKMSIAMGPAGSILRNGIRRVGLWTGR